MGPLISEINNNNCLSLFVRDFEREQTPKQDPALFPYEKWVSVDCIISLPGDETTPTPTPKKSTGGGEKNRQVSTKAMPLEKSYFSLRKLRLIC